MDLKKQNFIDSLLKLPSSNRTEVYTSVEIEQKILFMSDPIPQDRSGRIRWQRLHQRFKIVPYQTTKLLYLKKKENEDNNRDKRILSIEEMYDTILRVHIEHNHVRRDGLHKRLSEEYHGVTEKACVLFLANCEECHLRKAKKSVKSLVVKPISSTRFLSRCQVDLIDFRDMSETHNMADCGIPYKWLLVYQDHFTKYLLLRPLKHKSAVEVADVLEDIFCDLGPPHILQSDNGGEFSNNILFSLLNQKWPSTKIIHGKPRHPESQGSVERANREVKNGLASKMRDNSNDLCWVKYLKRVQFEKNTTFHSTVGMTPYDRLHDRMLVSAAKKFCPANVGDNVVVPIPRPDKMTSLAPRNMLGVVTDVSEGSYTIGTRDGTLSTNYTRNQFDVCSSNIFLQPSSIPTVTIAQTSAMRNASLGIDKNSFCRCKYCKTNRCACKKSGRSCGTKCHMGAKCFNS